MASTDDGTHTLSDDSSSIKHQENVSARASAPRTTRQPVRHRASVACASCRDRRIRCVVPKGESACTQCTRAGTACVIKNDDERRRPISKAYMSSLADRILLLERMLSERGVTPPPAVHPPKTRHEACPQTRQEQPPQSQPTGQPSPSFIPQLNAPLSTDGSPSRDDATPPESADAGQHDDSQLFDSGLAGMGGAVGVAAVPVPSLDAANSTSSYNAASPFRNRDPHKEDLVQRVLSTQGSLSFDQLSGRLRFFGPTANSHVYADAADAREPPEQVRRSERIIRSLTEATHDYLLACFWAFYNDIICVIDRDAFATGRATHNPKFYSSFLHITVLAMGYRFADRSRADIKKISLGNRESTLQREAKHMLDIELERPGGIPSVQALLLLGDLECGVGRDSTGWMYSGMANRLAFDIGLHVDCRSTDISAADVRIRHMVMKAAIVMDKYWALFLGRPTSIKSQDVGIDLLTKRFSTTASFPHAAPPSPPPCRAAKMSNEENYEYLVELMELAGKIVERRGMHNLGGPGHGQRHRNAHGDGRVFGLNDTQENAYLHVIRLDRQLQNWYRRLPDHLTWKPANIKDAPMSFFLLHQQYHVSMILLHRPWAKYGASTNSHPSPSSTTTTGGGDPQCIVDDSRTTLSRSICTQQAIRVARIFWQHRQRFDGRRICAAGIQHASTASIALIAALAHQQSSATRQALADRRSYLGCLEILSYALTDMSHTYQPASRMDGLLKAVLEQLRSDVYGPDATPPASASAHSMHPRSQGSDLPGWLGGAASLSGASSSNSNNGIDVYSVLPARRENPDSADALHMLKKRRPASPFFFPAEAVSSSAAASTAIHPPPSSNSNGNGILSSFDGQDAFNLDFLSGSAIAGDGVDDLHGMAGLLRSSMDDYVLVHSESDSWTLSESSQQHHSHSHSHGAFDMPIADWMMADSASGMPTFSTPTTTSKSGRQNEISHQPASAGSPKPRMSLGGPTPGPGPAVHSQGALSDDAKHIADWMDPVIREEYRHVDGSGRPLDALSPVSRTGLVVQTVETAGDTGDGAVRSSNAGARTARGEGEGAGERGAEGRGEGGWANAMPGEDEERNQDLDFFRF